ncbi:MAG: invasion associated locus B family protein [Pseudomonadota bacterium]
MTLSTKFAAAACAAAAISTVFTLGAAPASAQNAQPSWEKRCAKAGENDICNVQYMILANARQLVTAVNLMQVKGKQNRRIFQVAVPTSRYIPAGIKVKIDEGKENTLPYSLCLPDRCLAEIPLSDGLVKALKGGGKMTLTSTNFRSQKSPINVSLKGFTAAFDGPPLKANEVANRQRKLQEELQRKAKEAADKLKAAQDAAKASN